MITDFQMDLRGNFTALKWHYEIKYLFKGMMMKKVTAILTLLSCQFIVCKSKSFGNVAIFLVLVG